MKTTGSSTSEMTGALLGEGRYRLIALLGEGGMGAVYRGRDGRSGRDVAVKVLHPGLVREERTVSRFRREAEVMGLLEHPHVVGVFEASVDAGRTPFIVMELVEGETLTQLVRRVGLLSVSRSVGLTRQIVSVLVAAAEIGVVHRDLKPGNVMVTTTAEGEFVRVLDFGIARLGRPPRIKSSR